jgi:hypothetical protein
MRTAQKTSIVLGAALLLAAGAALAQQPTYKCVARGRVTYTSVPCTGGRVVGVHRMQETDKWKTPPQDRARIARRAPLSPEERQECSALDARMASEQAMLKAKGDAATLQDEMPLVHSKKRYRQLHC